nr:DUF5999 family protein [Pseudofrankia asymbiotica]
MSSSQQAARAGAAGSDGIVGPASAHGSEPTSGDGTESDAHSDPLQTGRCCQHQPICPNADAADRDAARMVRTHPDQGWSLLCNGVILFEDTGEILPTGRTVEPRRGPVRYGPARVPRPAAPRRAGIPAGV